MFEWAKKLIYGEPVVVKPQVSMNFGKVGPIEGFQVKRRAQSYHEQRCKSLRQWFRRHLKISEDEPIGVVEHIIARLDEDSRGLSKDEIANMKLRLKVLREHMYFAGT
jgi:hypothetical protein